MAEFYGHRFQLYSANSRLISCAEEGTTAIFGDYVPKAGQEGAGSH